MNATHSYFTSTGLGETYCMFTIFFMSYFVDAQFKNSTTWTPLTVKRNQNVRSTRAISKRARPVLRNQQEKCCQIKTHLSALSREIKPCDPMQIAARQQYCETFSRDHPLLLVSLCVLSHHVYQMTNHKFSNKWCVGISY